MPEMNLKQPRPTYSVSGPFTKNEEGIQKFKETDWRYIYWNKQDKACFQHNFYDGFKDLPRKTASDKTLRDKAFNIAKNPKYDGFQRALTSLLYNFFFYKKFITLANKFVIAGDSTANTSGGAIKTKLCQTNN